MKNKKDPNPIWPPLPGQKWSRKKRKVPLKNVFVDPPSTAVSHETTIDQGSWNNLLNLTSFRWAKMWPEVAGQRLGKVCTWKNNTRWRYGYYFIIWFEAIFGHEIISVKIFQNGGMAKPSQMAKVTEPGHIIYRWKGLVKPYNKCTYSFLISAKVAPPEHKICINQALYMVSMGFIL